MGARKRLRAEQLKIDRKSVSFAKLNNCPTSPRKMRLVTSLISGKEVNMAIQILRHTPKHAAQKLEKLILAAMDSWKSKNQSLDIDKVTLFVKEVKVDSAGMLKRIKPAPQGRAHRVRKRSNHVTLVLDYKE